VHRSNLLISWSLHLRAEVILLSSKQRFAQNQAYKRSQNNPKYKIVIRVTF